MINKLKGKFLNKPLEKA